GLAARQPTVLYVDDLQWGDMDSAALLADLVARPELIGALFVGSYRSDEAERSPLIRALLSAGGERPPRSVAVEALEVEDARALALDVLQRERAGDPARIDREAAQVASEAAGSPFFVVELA